VDTSGLSPGKHTIQVKSLDSKTESNIISINVSYPLYVVWSMDWEGYDCNNSYFDMIANLSNKYNVPITHFYNPRIYVALSKSRQDYFDKWIKARRDENSDEIEMHMHFFFDMVKAAGVTPKTDPKWSNYKDGKDVPATVYTTAEMEKILNWGKKKFEDRGLGTPAAFRSGAWYADESTLQALENTDFIIDSSGRSKYAWGTNKIPGHWDLKSTTKPYQPSKANQNRTGEPAFSLIEFPNNGADSWTYSSDQLISRFNDNYKGTPLGERQTITYLSHPHAFNVDAPKMEALFTYINQYQYNSDKGPVKYVRMMDAYAGWSLN
jgi:hypothetical protein